MDLLQKKALGLGLGLALVVSTVFIFIGLSVTNHARAVILSPRLATNLRGPASPGYGHNTTQFLEGTITIWVGSELVEATIPSEWMDVTKWSVALVPAVLPTAACYPCPVIDLEKATAPSGIYGGGLESNSLYKAALGLVCQVPADIAPITYNLAVGFLQPITPGRQLAGEINLLPVIGSWRGPIDSASNSPFSEIKPFILTEPNAVTIPWQWDAQTIDDIGKTTPDGNLVKPFMVLQLTDTHYNSISPEISLQNALWQNDTQVIAPDIIIHTGDLIDQPAERPEDYNLAYYSLNSIHLPIIMTAGNHDSHLMSPWNTYFGDRFGVGYYSALTVIKFDMSIPVGQGILQWISAEATTAIQNGPVLLASHYPIAGSYFSSGWLALADMMDKYQITGSLHGHTHDDLAGNLPTLIDQTVDAFLAGGGLDNLQIGSLYSPEANGGNILPPAAMVITRSSGKPGDVMLNAQFGFPISPYSGYRAMSIIKNQVVNYTYDYNGDGVRDAFLCVPNGRFMTKIIENPNLGLSPAANATWTLYNNMTEPIIGARAVFKLPLPPVGYHWDLAAENKTSGAYIRAMVWDQSSYWIDARVTVPAQGTVSLKMVPV